MDRLRVLIADDHAIVRAGIRSLLESRSEMEVVGEATNGREAIDAACLLRPDVVLMDVAMPGMNGLEATKELKKRSPAVRILALTIHENEEYFFAMLKAGASGYILKETEPNELVSALRAVYQGGIYVSPSVAKVVLKDYVSHPEIQAVPIDGGLTFREAEVLRLLAQGNTNRQIGDILCLSVKTVEKHRANIMNKLGFQSRSELVSYALHKGIIY